MGVGPTANTPRHSFSLRTSHALRSGVELGGGVRYVGDRYNNNRATRVAPGYRLVDAMAAYRVNENLTLRFHLTNAANLRYIDRVGGGHFIPGDVRSVSLTAGHQSARAKNNVTSLHHVRPVTRGVRLASFLWIQSMVRDDGERTLLFDLDRAIQEADGALGDHPATLELTNVFHNLLRRWAEL